MFRANAVIETFLHHDKMVKKLMNWFLKCAHKNCMHADTHAHIHTTNIHIYKRAFQNGLSANHHGNICSPASGESKGISCTKHTFLFPFANFCYFSPLKFQVFIGILHFIYLSYTLFRTNMQ